MELQITKNRNYKFIFVCTLLCLWWPLAVQRCYRCHIFSGVWNLPLFWIPCCIYLCMNFGFVFLCPAFLWSWITINYLPTLFLFAVRSEMNCFMILILLFGKWKSVIYTIQWMKCVLWFAVHMNHNYKAIKREAPNLTEISLVNRTDDKGCDRVRSSSYTAQKN